MRFVCKCTKYFNLFAYLVTCSDFIFLMKKYLLIASFLVLLSCGSTDDGNSILPNVPVNVTLNLNLPSYQDLLIDGKAVFVPNHGIKGIIVYRFSASNIVAWDAACPHIPPSQCSTMALNGVLMVCSCDNSEFSIIDGSPQSGTQYAARQYRVNKAGNSLTITNF